MNHENVDGGILAIWHDVTDDMMPEAERWYNTEHHFERLSIPGFRRASRFNRIEDDGDTELIAGRNFLSLYETETSEVLHSQAYIDRINNPSPWTKRVMPAYRNMNRTICDRIFALGEADGGAAGVIAFDAPSLEAANLDVETAARIRTAVETVYEEAYLQRALFFVASPSREQPDADERRLRNAPDGTISAAVVIVASQIADAKAALQQLSSLLESIPLGVVNGQVKALYRLAFAARSDDQN